MIRIPPKKWNFCEEFGNACLYSKPQSIIPKRGQLSNQAMKKGTLFAAIKQKFYLKSTSTSTSTLTRLKTNREIVQNADNGFGSSMDCWVLGEQLLGHNQMVCKDVLISLQIRDKKSKDLQRVLACCEEPNATITGLSHRPRLHFSGLTVDSDFLIIFWLVPVERCKVWLPAVDQHTGSSPRRQIWLMLINF